MKNPHFKISGNYLQTFAGEPEPPKEPTEPTEPTKPKKGEPDVWAEIKKIQDQLGKMTGSTTTTEPQVIPKTEPPKEPDKTEPPKEPDSKLSEPAKKSFMDWLL